MPCDYILQIDNLIWMGRLQGNALLELHQQLHAYLMGKVSGETLQAKIDLYDRGWMP